MQTSASAFLSLVLKSPTFFHNLILRNQVLGKQGNMDVKEVLHMSGGDGENSYYKTSTNVQEVARLTKPVVASAVDSVLKEPIFPCKLLNVADLGCSAGPSTFTFMSTVLETVQSSCGGSGHAPPEMQFYLNDLPGNDFNTLFKNLSDFHRNLAGRSFFVVGAPGSFHERIFPRNCLHLVHSCYSVHWLSRVPRLTTEGGSPLNKGKIYISKTSPPEVWVAYLSQFQEDLTNFLRCRSQEMVIGARLVLVLNGRRSADPAIKESCYIWELLAEAISSLVTEGLVEKEKLDTLDVPYYIASQEEVRQIVQQEGSFTVERIEMLVVERDEDPRTRGKKMAETVRSFTGSIIQHHLGEEVMDRLYGEKLACLIGEDSSKEPGRRISIVLVLRKHA